MEIKNTKFYSNIMHQKDFLHKANMKFTYLLIPSLLSLTGAFFEGISAGLLIPIIKGIIQMDFGFVREMYFFRTIIAKFPHLFIRPNSSVFMLLLGIIFIAAIIKNILLYFASITIDYEYRRFASNMRKSVLSRYFNFGKLFFDRTSKGYLYNLLVSFTYSVAHRLVSVHKIIKWFFVLGVYITIMVIISWKLTLFVLIAPPILFYSSKWLIEKIKRTSKYFTESKSTLSTKLTNIFSCIPLIKLYTSEKKEEELFGYASDDVATFEFSMDKKERLIEPFHEIILLAIVLLLVSLMAFLVIKDKSGEVSGFLVYFYLLRKATGAFGTLAATRAELAKSSGPLDEVLKIFDDKDKYFIPEGKKIFDGLKRTIEFNHLNFFYIPQVQVLKDISFTVEKGKMTAIVGPTGSGKTTIINLLLRFYDCSPSSILVDGIDIREFTLKSLRAHMALVSQDTLLFDDTLRINMTYGAGKISEEKLIDMAKKARLYDFVRTLPDKFDTYIGDRGVKLSGGEKQRVAIARAMLKGAEILILDEATSSLDSITEKLIQEAIEAAVKDRTSIVIAHRLSTIKNADKIVVIEDGRLIEEGTLRELLDKKRKFYQYWEEQKFD